MLALTFTGSLFHPLLLLRAVSFTRPPFITLTLYFSLPAQKSADSSVSILHFHCNSIKLWLLIAPSSLNWYNSRLLALSRLSYCHSTTFWWYHYLVFIESSQQLVSFGCHWQTHCSFRCRNSLTHTDKDRLWLLFSARLPVCMPRLVLGPTPWQPCWDYSMSVCGSNKRPALHYTTTGNHTTIISATITKIGSRGQRVQPREAAPTTISGGTV